MHPFKRNKGSGLLQGVEKDGLNPTTTVIHDESMEFNPILELGVCGGAPHQTLSHCKTRKLHFSRPAQLPVTDGSLPTS